MASGIESTSNDGGIDLDDKYRVERGEVYLSGIQALVRLPLMQARRDAAAGYDTAGFISGYRGSPLAGLDQQLWRAGAFLDHQRVQFRPGLNEELAATAVWGSQQVGLHPGARYAGVFGMWYGKAPGVDRACDALRHANAAGTAPLGGVLAICGDDHACKSSSYPTQSEFALMHLEMPVLSPSSVQEVLDFGLLGWAMSRYTGLWVGMIAVADLMDSSTVVAVAPERASVRLPDDFAIPRDGLGIRADDDPRDQERRLREAKLPAALAFARANALNRILIDSTKPRLVVVSSGKSSADALQALHDLGIDARLAEKVGLRLVQVGMPWPLDPIALRRFTRGAEKVLVVEEKRDFIESQLKSLLYELPDGERPRVVGKRDEFGAPLLAAVGDLDSVAIARAIALQLPPGVSTEPVDDHLARLAAGDVIEIATPEDIVRTPFFCSGCPHNRSTVVPDGSRALVGIGCHYMVHWMDRESAHHSQMGGEGVAWIGQQDFTEESHVFANLGDGTYFHSGILAIRAAIAADVRITFKLLYNHAVAMTGGQPVDGMLDVPRITRQLAAEGVERIVVVTEDTARYAEARGEMASNVPIEPRTRLDAVQRELREVAGVTVLIYDQGCAAELRRKRKRGLVADPDSRVFINERVCEGCGDCSTTSNCLSVEPVETELGQKRRINQSSCNKDFSCLEGSCPALVRVVGGERRRSWKPELDALLADLPAPPISATRETREVTNIVIAGIGGTGVTTAAALLGMAAHIEGRASAVLDMTGLAQKGGAVVSHVRIASSRDELHGSRVPRNSADLLLGADSVVSASATVLDTLHPRRTRAIVNAHVTPTAQSVGKGDRPLPSAEELLARVRRVTCELEACDASHHVEEILGDSIVGNLFLLGQAVQSGWLPLEAASIVSAIEINGVAVEINLRAFALGRLQAFDPKRLADLYAPSSPLSQDFDDWVLRRLADLERYQDFSYAERYRGRIERAVRIERDVAPGSQRFGWAVARSLYRLMAYKDEYEVARLHSDGEFRNQIAREMQGDYRIEWQLAPPLFASRDPETGRLRKRAYGPWALSLMGFLARLRFLRGTLLDPFGALADRRLERRLLGDFEKIFDELFEDLGSENHELACRIAEIPQKIRGFDRIKSETAEAKMLETEALLERFRAARRISGASENP